MKEINVIGAMQLFAACQRAERLRKVVVRSSTAVYGASPHDPAMFTEGMTSRGELHGFGKDAFEVEGYARTMARRSPHLQLTVFRFANFIGPRIDSAMSRYLSLRLVPTALGYDPRLQLVHEDDAVEVLRRAVREDHPGTFNVAGEGVIPLSRVVRLMGRASAPVVLPVASPLAEALQRLGAVDFPADQVALLVYGRGVDTSRLAEEFAWRPEHSSRDALLEFVRARKSRGPLTPERVAGWERRIREMLGREAAPSRARAASDG
jgi:UDP-glucose 4-epimerase